MSDQLNERLSPTAQESSGILGLGRSGGQRSAEMLAGVRAQLMPVPEYVAMTSAAGRIIGGIITRLARSDQGRLHLAIARPEAFRALVAQALEGKAEAHYVELASGFLPRGWQLASALPQLRVTEIDLPEVIAEKQKRFARAGLAIPPNLRMLSADLGVRSLTEVLQGEQADVFSAEGLLMYLTLESVQRLALGVHQSLRQGGVFIADVLTQESVRALNQSKIRQAASLFRRNAGQWIGVVEDYDHARRLFEGVGYSQVEIHDVSNLAERLTHVPRPVSAGATIVVAHK
ncbi:MAG: class I SAM-dependent methyltransferase [Anaerolineae bacterium]|nr:class I SAM-dependent methyltransferase [Anaerolineae bacterium]